MSADERTGNIKGVEFKVVYSRRRTLGISVLPDATVVVRVPYRTSDKTIVRIVEEKSEWIIKHRDSYQHLNDKKPGKAFSEGEKHLYRGNELLLKIEKSVKPFVWFSDGIIDMGLAKPDDQKAVKRMLYIGYKLEADLLFPEILNRMLLKHENQNFKPTGLRIRSMKRRWGSCSSKGMITLSTELIKLDDRHIEYVIVHELCHLKHHNHSSRYYELLSELFPEYKEVRKEMRKFIV
jgi:predicted metal-dependent hydrolase